MQTASAGEVPHERADIGELAKAQRPRKAEILASATTYMKQMEDSNRLLREEIESLKAKNQELERNTRCENCWLRNDFGNMTFEGVADWVGHNHVLLETMERKCHVGDEEPSTISD